MQVSQSSLNRVYRSIKSSLLLLISALTLFFLFFGSPPLLFLSEFWFFYWYGKRRYREAKTVREIKKNSEFRREVFVNRINERTRFGFAESRLYRFFAAAPYSDSLSFLEHIREDWSDTAVSIIREYYRIEDEKTDVAHFPEAVRNGLSIYQADRCLDTFRIRAGDFKDRYRNYIGKEAVVHTLCHRTNEVLDPDDFTVRDRYEYSSHEKVIQYQDEEVSEDIVLPSASTREKKVLEFMNKILQKKDLESRFFTNQTYIYFGTVKQMNYLMDELDQSGPLTAPGYLCLPDPSD